MSWEEKIAFYASCDVLSVPSRMSESFGLYLIESLRLNAARQPSVAGVFRRSWRRPEGASQGPNTAAALVGLSRCCPDPARLDTPGGRAGRAAVFAADHSDEAMRAAHGRCAGPGIRVRYAPINGRRLRFQPFVDRLASAATSFWICRNGGAIRRHQDNHA